MKYSVGDIISIQGSEYSVIGRITFMNQGDSCYWDEYRLMSLSGNGEAWLSIDETYKEYSISWMTRISNEPSDFRAVDSGRAVVVSRGGDVDVDSGEYVDFVEYEDITEEKIFSKEIWSDETEYSQGYYLDEEEISFVRSEPHMVTVPKRKKGGIGCVAGLIITVVSFAVIILLILAAMGVLFPKTIESYIKSSNSYTYLTSITGEEGQKADVYKSVFASTDTAARDIINAIEGNTTFVQQNNEDSDDSIAILTSDEYCLVYHSDENDDILVQISGRKYAYTSDKELYHGTSYSRRYFRRFYRSLGYVNDTNRYSSSNSSYTSYNDSDISYDSNNSYQTYSRSVRQASINARRSSGGGISSGK